MHGREREPAEVRAWARVARAAADVYGPGRTELEANGVLFDAIEFAATAAKLDLAELVDAYLAGAPELDVSEAWDEVEDFLARISRLQGEQLHRVVALPQWRERLRVRIAAHDLALAAHRLLGDHDEQIDRARLAVVEVLAGATAGGATQDELDAFVRQLRCEQSDLAGVIAAAAWITAQRDRRHAAALPAAAWATSAEIAQDRGVAVDFVDALVAEALARGLLTAVPGRGVRLTAAGEEFTAREMRV